MGRGKLGNLRAPANEGKVLSRMQGQGSFLNAQGSFSILTLSIAWPGLQHTWRCIVRCASPGKAIISRATSQTFDEHLLVLQGLCWNWLLFGPHPDLPGSLLRLHDPQRGVLSAALSLSEQDAGKLLFQSALLLLLSSQEQTMD